MIQTTYPKNPDLWQEILAAKNKGEIIQAMRSYLSSRGAFSDAPEEVFEKLEKQ